MLCDNYEYYGSIPYTKMPRKTQHILISGIMQLLKFYGGVAKMVKTKKVLGLFLALAMLITLIAPISAIAYEPGDPFSGSLDFNTTNWTWFHSPVTGYEYISGKLTVGNEAGAGYSGGYASKIEFGAGMKGGNFFYLKFPDEVDFSGLKEFSFYAKTDCKLKFRLHDVASGTLHQIEILPSNEYVKYEAKDLVDPTGFEFTTLYLARINIDSCPGSGGTVYISDFNYSGIRPGEIEEPDYKLIEHEFGKLAIDWDNVYPIGDVIKWQEKKEEGWSGSSAKLLSYAGLGQIGRAGLIIPPPPSEYGANYSKIKYLSFLVKNVTPDPSTSQNCNFTLKAGGDTIFTTPIKWDMDNIEQWRDKWVEYNIAITDSSGNDFAGLDRLVITGLPTGNKGGQLLFSRLILSTDPIPLLDTSYEGTIEVTSVKVNGVENPTDLTAGENTVEITASNTTAVDKNALLVVALFEKDTNVLYAMNVVEGTLIADEDNTLSASVTVGQDAENYVLKAFLWDSPSNIKPITDVLITLGE